jgi:hypothetical protein
MVATITLSVRSPALPGPASPPRRRKVRRLVPSGRVVVVVVELVGIVRGATMGPESGRVVVVVVGVVVLVLLEVDI